MSTVLVRQAANALLDVPVPDVRDLAALGGPRRMRAPVGHLRLAMAATQRSLERFRRRHGGLWVGGWVTVTTDGVYFSPNAMNRDLHPGTDRHVPLRDITGVDVRFGWVTKVIEITAATGTGLTVRCFGAAHVASTIRDTARR